MSTRPNKFKFNLQANNQENIDYLKDNNSSSNKEQSDNQAAPDENKKAVEEKKSSAKTKEVISSKDETKIKTTKKNSDDTNSKTHKDKKSSSKTSSGKVTKAVKEEEKKSSVTNFLKGTMYTIKLDTIKKIKLLAIKEHKSVQVYVNEYLRQVMEQEKDKEVEIVLEDNLFRKYGQNKRAFNIRLENDIYDFIKERAMLEGISASQYVEKWLDKIEE